MRLFKSNDLVTDILTNKEKLNNIATYRSSSEKHSFGKESRFYFIKLFMAAIVIKYLYDHLIVSREVKKLQSSPLL